MKYKFLKVTTEKLYIIPMIDEERTEINGWDIDTVIRDWFKDYPLSKFHATRETHEVGNSEKVLHTQVINSLDEKPSPPPDRKIKEGEQPKRRSQ